MNEWATAGCASPSTPCSCSGCPVVSWRSWLGDSVNLFPWNCSVTGVSGWEMRFWPPAMLASWAIFTTSPPSVGREKNTPRQRQHSATRVAHVDTLHRLVKGVKETQNMQNWGGLIAGGAELPSTTEPEQLLRSQTLKGKESGDKGETGSLKHVHVWHTEHCTFQRNTLVTRKNDQGLSEWFVMCQNLWNISTNPLISGV